jgi:hypothetical protein
MYFVVTEEFRGIRDRDQTDHRILHKVVRHYDIDSMIRREIEL